MVELRLVPRLLALSWSAWLQGTFYVDAHGIVDLSIRVFTFGQMISLAVTAAFIADVPGDGATGPGLAANSLILAVMWFRTGYHNRTHRAGAYPFSALYVTAGMLFTCSTLTDMPTGYWLWDSGSLCSGPQPSRP